MAKAEPTLVENLWEFAKQRLRTLELFPEYLKSIINHWNEIFFLSIPALPFVAWWYLGEPPMWIRVAVFLWVLVIAGYYAWRADHLILMPKIALRFENRIPFKQPSPMEGIVGVKMFFRVFPDCSSPVPNCTGHLLAVYREIDGHWKPTLFNEAVLLTWADGRVGPITIEPRIGPYLNVFCTDSDEKEIMPCLANPMLRTSAMFRKRSVEKHMTFRFDIQVTNGAPISLKVRMDDRPSYWDRPLIEVVPDDGKSSN